MNNEKNPKVNVIKCINSAPGFTVGRRYQLKDQFKTINNWTYVVYDDNHRSVPIGDEQNILKGISRISYQTMVRSNKKIS
mgnify:CR=1